jgi:hypothetical protein
MQLFDKLDGPIGDLRPIRGAGVTDQIVTYLRSPVAVVARDAIDKRRLGRCLGAHKDWRHQSSNPTRKNAAQGGPHQIAS